MANPLSEVQAALDKLSSRDRKLLALMGTVLALLLVFAGAHGISSKASKEAHRIALEQGQLREVATLTAGYRQAESQRMETEAKLKGHAVRDLFSYLETLGKKDDLDIGGMTDKGSAPAGDDKSANLMQSSVEVTLTHVPLDKLTKFLNDVETNPGMVRVTRLSVRPRDDAAVLDAWFTVSTFYIGS
jgi:type II secretory pathway component PulM